MARSGLYKSDIQRARDSLRAQGKHPSVEAIRVALGNTGSNSTIHRYLKELEQEEGQGLGAKLAVSDALQDLVGRLAGRLHEEAETAVADAKQRLDVQLLERDQALAASRQEAAALSEQLQRTETALQGEREAQSSTVRTLTERTTVVAQLEERIAGLITRVGEHEAHARSLEEKHQHAREALEHYRTSVKDQRDQEQRRHEQQIQELQVALRQANEALTGKNHELLELNRDNGKWVERFRRQEQELAQVRTEARAQLEELDTLRLMAIEHQALQGRWAQDTHALDTARTELGAARADYASERERRTHAETEALRASVRLETLEHLLEKLRPLPADPVTASATEPSQDTTHARGGKATPRGTRMRPVEL